MATKVLKMLEPSEVDSRQPVSLEEIERLGEGSRTPRFATECRTFVAAYETGDEVVEFCTAMKSWNLGNGRAGYWLIRNGFVEAELIVRMS